MTNNTSTNWDGLLNVFMDFFSGAFHESGSPAWFMSVSHKANTVADNLTWISLLSEEATLFLAQK